jgi:hypothetical protein
MNLCDFWYSLQPTEQIDTISKALTLVVATILAVKAIWEYVRAQRWKRFEYMAAEMKALAADANSRKVMMMLDWRDREVELFPERTTDKPVLVTDQLLLSALHPNDYGANGQGYTDEEARIRDLFDGLFDKLTVFAVCLRSGLIQPRDLRAHLSYWLNKLTNPASRGKNGPIFVQTIRRFLQYYQYDDLCWMLDKLGFSKPES